MDDGGLILIVALLLAAALMGSVVAERLRLPGLLLFLLVGMAVGDGGTGWVRLDDLEVARLIGTVAVALILFEGGLSAPVAALPGVLRPALLLAVPGTVVTGLVTGVVAIPLLHLGVGGGLLTGAILASTDGAAVFGLLRATALRPRISRILEGEAGFNDPVAVLLVLGITNWLVNPRYGALDMLSLFAQQLAVGLACGVLVGLGSARVLARVRLPVAGLYPVASITVAGLAYGSAAVLHGSGFLAVYVAGLALAASRRLPVQGMVAVFNEGLSWVAQVTLFLTFGLLVLPAEAGSVLLGALVLALVLACFARPLAVLVVTARQRLSAPERALLGWAGLRGGVPVVLATFPIIAGVPGSRRLLDVAFLVVVATTVLQALTLERVARALGLTSAEPALPRALRDVGTASRLGAELAEYRVGPADNAVGRRLRDLPLPPDATVMMIVRGEQAIPPHSDTWIETGDHVHMLVREEAAAALMTSLDEWEHGARQYDRRLVEPRPWTAALGDPAHPVRLAGLAVVEHVRQRGDRRGALVLLEDGSHAITGPALIVGDPMRLCRYAEERLRRAGTAPERAWWRDVADALG